MPILVESSKKKKKFKIKIMHFHQLTHAKAKLKQTHFSSANKRHYNKTNGI